MPFKTLNSSMHPIYNITAYFVRPVGYVCKMFMNSTTGVNAIKSFFFSSLKNKLECFVHGKPFQLSLIFAN
jgi:hypothetical protein